MIEEQLSAEALSETAVRLSIVIRRPPERVFDAWTSSSEFVKWFVPEPGLACTIYEMDVRPGGSYRITVGCSEHPRCITYGKYTVVDRPTKLAFTWAHEDVPDGVESLVTVDFVPVEEGTRLVLTHDKLKDAESRDGHTHGWTGCLLSIRAYLEADRG